MKVLSQIAYLAILPFAFALSGCTANDILSPTASTTAVTYAIAVVSGNNQIGTIGGPLTTDFVAVVTNAKTGQGIVNVTVDWAVISGGGSFTRKFSNSTVNGEVSANLSLGSAIGASTVTATIHGTNTSVEFFANGIIGTPYAANCTIVGSSPAEPDGVNPSSIMITLKDIYKNPTSGYVPTFSATGRNNTYGACSASNALGISYCTFTSTTSETKIISIASPVSTIGGTVIFTPTSVVAGNSSITGTSGIVANAIASSTVTITLKDINNVGVSGLIPTFSATDTGSTNVYGTCSATGATGVSTCTLLSTKAEIKTLSITSPVSEGGGAVTFTHGPSATTQSTITGTGPVEPDGVATSTVTILLRDAYSNPVDATTPTFTASGNTNSYGVCSATDATGASSCTLSSTTVQTKTLSLSTPINFAGGTIVFAPTAVTVAHTTITGSSSVVADGIATSVITITLKDAANIAVGGVVPTFSATDTGVTNSYGTCSSSNATTGISTCTLSSRKAETKTLQLTSPVSLSGGTVVFISGAPSSVTSTITASGPTVADGVSTSTATLTLLDVYSNPVSGVVPTFSATNTGTTNAYGACSVSNAITGISTCTLSSTKAETKTLSLLTPVAVTGGTAVFTHGATSAVTSTITGSGPVEPDGVTASTITITLLDAFSNPVNAVTPTYSATNTGGSNGYGACSASSVLGVSTCALTSTKTETKTLSLTAPVSFNGGTVVFTPGAASVLHSSIAGTGPVVANGAATSAITIIIKDASNVAIAGVTPTFTATNASNGNTYGACSSTDASGTSTCTLASTYAQTKTLTIATPINLAGGTIVFTAGTASAGNSQITGTGPVIANGIATSTVTVLVYDAHNNPIAGTTPTFSATDTGTTNQYGACSSSDVTGASTCTLSSTKAEVKTLSLSTPVSLTGGTVSFTAAAASASTSTIVGTGSVAADGTATSSVTITLLDANSNPVVGTTPTFSATNTGGLNTYMGCSATNGVGVSTCSLKSTRAETKILSLSTPAAFAGGSVVFTQVASIANSTITGTGPIAADGATTSTITITIKDYANIAIVGVTPTFTATNTGGTNSYGACSATDGTGASTCTLTSSNAETKTLSISSPISTAGGTVQFN